MFQGRVWFYGVLFVYALACRLLPYVLYQFGMPLDPATTWYPWNFSPLMAIALFGGATAVDRRLGFAIPLGVLLLSDLGIWGLTGHIEFAFPASQPMIYACFAAATWMGTWLRQRPRISSAVPTAMVAESLFFLVTNFLVWAMGDGAQYPLTPAGLSLCYAMGLPFFGRSLVSTSLYVVALFSPIGLGFVGTSAREPAEVDGRAVPAKIPS